MANFKHISKITVKNGYLGKTIWRLFDSEGLPIQAWDEFQKFLVDKVTNKFATRKRYSEAGALLVDYLYELSVLGQPATNLQINTAINSYTTFLRLGPAHPDPRLSQYARDIGFGGLKTTSFAPELAGVNCFLRKCQDLGDAVLEKARMLGVAIPKESHLLIEAVHGSETIGHRERKRMVQNSMLGGVIRQFGKFTRPSGLKVPRTNKEKQDEMKDKDFPIERFGDLIAAATSYRDKAYWSLIGAAGLRPSEARNVRMLDVDPITQRVWVNDPDLVRYGNDMTPDEKVRFKGRATSRTCMFEPLKSEFFKWYALYLKREYIPTTEHDFLFQQLTGEGRGKPFKDVSDTALLKAFKKAVSRAGIPGPAMEPDQVWTPRSMRHMYGVYMLNYLPVKGGPGLDLKEVQRLMGHTDIKSTAVYARVDDDILAAKVEYADRVVYDAGIDIDAIPGMIAQRLRQVAQQLEDRAKARQLAYSLNAREGMA